MNPRRLVISGTAIPPEVRRPERTRLMLCSLKAHDLVDELQVVDGSDGQIENKTEPKSAHDQQ
jgi:hypothetical protein